MSSTLVLKSTFLNPFKNLALGAYLSKCFRTPITEKGSLAGINNLLLLSTSHHGVFIGRNQNYLAECNLPEMIKDKVPLLRRDTGGGACYVDQGNRLFTFITRGNISRDDNYNVILQALNSLGIKAELRGRNDITVNGLKVSGSAFHMDAIMRHHGTILVDVDKDKLSAYLNPSKLKLQAHGVASIRSRIANLRDFAPDLAHDDIDTAIIHAWNSKDTIVQEFGDEDIKNPELFWRLYNNLQSENFIYNENPRSDVVVEEKFEHGLYTFYVVVDKRSITSCSVYSDSLDFDFVIELRHYINANLPLTHDSFEYMLKTYNGLYRNRIQEIITWLLTKIL